MAGKEEKYRRLSDCSCNMIRESARKITQFYESELREAGIKPTQFSILAALANTGPVPLTLLADRLLLERKGWVQVQTGEEDSRQRVVSLSERGYEQLDHAIPYWKKAQKVIENVMGQDTITELKTTLDEMTKSLAP